MKKMFMSLASISFLACSLCSSAYALSDSVTVRIPDHYALLVFTGAKPDEPLDKEALLARAKEVLNEEKVQQLQFVVYDEGKKQGDGIRANDTLAVGEEASVDSILEIPKKDKENKTISEKKYILGTKSLENFIGCYISPKDLHNAFSDNEVIADEDFKGKPLLLIFTVPKVAKDALGKPYIKLSIDKVGLKGIQIYLDKKDPFLRKIKKGSNITVRATTKNFIMDTVMLDGTIVMADGVPLIDGKITTKEEIEKLN